MSYATVDELAGALRVRVTAENTPGLQACLDAAAEEIDHEIDWPVGAAAPAGQWIYSSSTVDADPGDGQVRRNGLTAPATTELYVDSLTADGVDAEAGLAGLLAGDLVRLSDSSYLYDQYELNADAALQTGYVKLPVDLSSSSLGGGPDLVDGASVVLAFLRLTKPVAQRLALANRVNILRGVEWFKAQDAAFGVIGFDQTGALQAPRDGFARHAYTLTPLKRQWGIA